MVSQETIDKILSMYIDKDFQKEVLRTPIVQGKHVYAFEGHIMIRISKNLAETDYPAAGKPDCAIFFRKKSNCNITVSAFFLAEKIKESTVMIPETYQQERVREDDCPVCDGTGYTEGGAMPTGRMIPDTSVGVSLGSATFQRKYLQVLLDTLELLGEEEFAIIRSFPDKENTFVLNENVRVLLMPALGCY